jgi:Tfp pilus assembly protein PilF
MSIKSIVNISCLLFLVGCSSTDNDHVNLSPSLLFIDNTFEKPENLAQVSDIYYLSEQQKAWLDLVVRPSVRQSFTRQLIDKLLKEDYRAFEYDNSFTRTATQTLSSKQGNCLSMVILSVAMAKYFDINYKIYDVKTAPIWDRNGGLFLVNGHVNVQLKDTNNDTKQSLYQSIQNGYLTLDFLPQASRRSLAKKRINERELAAMYFANLAADAMVVKDWNRAYWLLKESIVNAPRFSVAWNSLAVLYRYNDNDELAEKVYKYALALEPADNHVVANLAILLSSQGRYQELFDYQRQLDLSELKNPYRYFDKAQYAYGDKDFGKAIKFYKKAIKISPQVDLFYFGLYQAYLATGNQKSAIKYLKIAEKKSSTTRERNRYNAKLAIFAKAM